MTCSFARLRIASFNVFSGVACRRHGDGDVGDSGVSMSHKSSSDEVSESAWDSESSVSLTTVVGVAAGCAKLSFMRLTSGMKHLWLPSTSVSSLSVFGEPTSSVDELCDRARPNEQS
eukprot:CAMPEP_0169071662 /NCGR_PEP_ID=MMETSP1015-20121227/5771_1 /TAXON_ID=342587 /ORGANISM="Karlodinium micrum, Strain CCMP2283" /LENGTH=116 /DNA_ID=CAMNT_0009130747 /DNA_START=496 /DNA_END=846 /DNA_ORIENTATION=-